MAEPPLYLLLGSDAYSRAFSKLDLLASSYQQWEALTKSTDFDKVEALRQSPKI